MLIGRYGVGAGGSGPTLGAISAISSNTNSSNATNTIPGSVFSGALIWAHVTVVGGPSTITMPAGQGWTLATSAVSSGGNATAALYWKVWGSGSTDSATVAVTGTGGNMRTVLGIVTNARYPSPVIGSAGSGGTVSGTTLTAPSSTGISRALVGRFFTASGTLQSINDAALSYQGAAYSFTAGFDGACAGVFATSSADPTGAFATTASVSGEWAALTVAFQP